MIVQKECHEVNNTCIYSETPLNWTPSYRTPSYQTPSYRTPSILESPLYQNSHYTEHALWSQIHLSYLNNPFNPESYLNWTFNLSDSEGLV